MGLSLRYRDLNFEIDAPNLFFRNGRGTALFRPDHIDLTGIHIETESSSLRVDGYIRNLSDPKIDLSLNAEPLASEELKSLLPNFPFVGPMGLTAFLTGSTDSLVVSGALNTVGGGPGGKRHPESAGVSDNLRRDRLKGQRDRLERPDRAWRGHGPQLHVKRDRRRTRVE